MIIFEQEIPHPDSPDQIQRIKLSISEHGYIELYLKDECGGQSRVGLTINEFFKLKENLNGLESKW